MSTDDQIKSVQAQLQAWKLARQQEEAQLREEEEQRREQERKDEEEYQRLVKEEAELKEAINKLMEEKRAAGTPKPETPKRKRKREGLSQSEAESAEPRDKSVKEKGLVAKQVSARAESSCER